MALTTGPHDERLGAQPNMQGGDFPALGVVDLVMVAVDVPAASLKRSDLSVRKPWPAVRVHARAVMLMRADAVADHAALCHVAR